MQFPVKRIPKKQSLLCILARARGVPWPGCSKINFFFTDKIPPGLCRILYTAGEKSRLKESDEFP
jgi:hypothetical protein